MKTGIVRRIDELGRVVIPKEIRRTMRIREGEELEVFVTEENELMLKKFSPVKNLYDFCTEYADLLYRHTGYNCLICDLSGFVTAASDKKNWEGKQISHALEKFLQQRKSAYFREDNLSLLPNSHCKNIVCAPLVSCGDVLGGILLISDSVMTMPDTLVRLLEIGGDFLARQMQ